MVIAIAMIEPQYHINVGHVARLMKNFGLKTLYFVKPRFDEVEAVRYSTHGKDVLAAAKTITLDLLRKKFDILIGTTAIGGTSKLNVLRQTTSAERMAALIHEGHGKNYCILLGRESSGLTNKELAMCDLAVIVDTKTKYRTMNIAHALAIMLYEISRLKPQLRARKSRKKVELASLQDIDLLIQYISKVADASHYDLHKKPMLEAAVKKMIAKSVPTSKDVMLLVSLFRRSMLAIERKNHAGQA